MAIASYNQFTTILLLAGLSQAEGTCRPSTEVVSIYKDNSWTPSSGVLQPYFIKVGRCVECSKCLNENYPRDYPVPDITTTIKAVVHNSASGKSYEYSVYNHTTCKCGTKSERDGKLYGGYKEVDKKTANNPDPVENPNEPKPRYKLTGDHLNPRYYLVKRCLPMCKAVQQEYRTITAVHTNTAETLISYKMDLKCNCSAPVSRLVFGGNKIPDGTKDFSLNIDSKKSFFVVIFLGVVLVTICIVDFIFCRHKRGFCYSLVTCNSDEMKRCPKGKVEETFV